MHLLLLLVVLVLLLHRNKIDQTAIRYQINNRGDDPYIVVGIDARNDTLCQHYAQQRQLHHNEADGGFHFRSASINIFPVVWQKYSRACALCVVHFHFRYVYAFVFVGRRCPARPKELFAGTLTILLLLNRANRKRLHLPTGQGRDLKPVWNRYIRVWTPRMNSMDPKQVQCGKNGYG